jgi:Raf kinase inhibitor-like YbhB/YbcL family protein
MASPTPVGLNLQSNGTTNEGKVPDLTYNRNMATQTPVRGPTCEAIHKAEGLYPAAANWLRTLAAGGVLLLQLSACLLPSRGVLGGGTEVQATQGDIMTFDLSSDAFKPGGPIPARFTCDGQDISPPLRWAGVPAGTVSLALIMDDPDAPAGIWVHWVLYNIPLDRSDLSEATSAQPAFADGSVNGLNSWGRSGYGGPCPPGGMHRYFFRLYAVDLRLDLQPGATKEAVLAAVQGHVLGQAELMGTYTRAR